MSRRARSGSLGPTPAQIKALLGIATAAFIIADNVSISGTLGVTGVATFGNTVSVGSATIYSNGNAQFNIIRSDAGIWGGANGNGALTITAGAGATFTGTGNASAGLARGVIISNTLNASANGDTLVGLDINPTLNAGIYTNVLPYYLRVRGQSLFENQINVTNNTGIVNTTYGSTKVNFGGMLDLSGQAGISFSAGTTRVATLGSSFILQNGGTFTDVASSRFTVNSTTQGSLPAPRVTASQRGAIDISATTAVQGLLVYQTDGSGAEGYYAVRAGAWNQFVTIDSSGNLSGTYLRSVSGLGTHLTITDTSSPNTGLTITSSGGNSVIRNGTNGLELSPLSNTVNNVGSYRTNANITNAGLNNICSFIAVPTINQSSTSGYNIFYASVYEQAVGSGQRNLIDVGTNTAAAGLGTHTSKFRVDSTGAVTLNSISPITGNNYINIGGNGIIVPNVYSANIATTNSAVTLRPNTGFDIFFNTDNTNRAVVKNTTGNFIIQPAGGTMTDVPVAALQIVSTTQGFLGPNMTQAQRTAITAVQGLRVYQTDGGTAEGEYVYRGGSWSQFLTVNSSGVLSGGDTTVNGTFTSPGYISGNRLLVDTTATAIGIQGTAGILFRVSSKTVNDLSSANTTAIHAINTFGQPTLTATNAQTYTIASNVYIAGPPVASAAGGGVVTIGTPYSLYVNQGNSYFGGTLKIGTSTGSIQNSVVFTDGYSVAGFNINANNLYSQGALNVKGDAGLNLQTTAGTALSINTSGSALIQINSTTQGFLGPNMTQAQRTAISSPAQGLKVYQTDGGSSEGDWVYRGGAWCQNVTYLAGTNNISTSGTLTVSGGITTYNPLTAIAFYATSTSNTNPSTVGTIIKINGMTHNDYNTAASATVPHVALSGIGRPTLAAGNTGISYTNASTLYLEGAPIAGTNVSITNPYTLFINQGSSYFGGFVNVGANFQANQIYSPNNIQATGIMTATGGIGANISSFHSSAIMQADSTTKGFLPPRMNTSQKNAISSPATGLVVFDTDLGKLCVYSGGWQTLTSA